MSDKNVVDFKGHPDYLALTKEELKLHSAKNSDYAGDVNNDPLGNFKRVSAIKSLYPGLDWTTAHATAVDFMLKQFDCALLMLAEGREGEVEDIESRLQDSYIYLKIARILYREWKNRSLVDKL